MKPRLFLFFLTLSVTITGIAQPPEGYYNSTGLLTGKVLQQSLHDIIDNHTVVLYENLYLYFRKTDIRSDSSVWDMYSDKPAGTPPYVYFYGKGQECGNYNSENDCFNREHSFPKSWFNDLPPMNSDLFHIYPTDGYVNNRRANYSFGETKTPNWVSLNGSKVGICSWPGFSGIVFEPIDEYKGDFARTCFYMATRYFGEDKNWQGSDMVAGAEPNAWARELLLQWHRNDTVSKKERNRNNEVFKVQNNRNPFIDNPVFAEMIWGRLNIANDYFMNEPKYVIMNTQVSDLLWIRNTNKQVQPYNVLIYNVQGIRVIQTRIESNTGNVDLSGIVPGIYLVKISSERGVSTQKIIKK